MIAVGKPGLLTTVQDLGRPGYAHLGISASGAADPLALRVGNLLVGNAEGAAALETTLLGGSYEFRTEAVIAITGAACAIPGWQPLRVRAGETLDLGPLTAGARSYLCVRGGIAVPPVLGSASTHLVSRMGGFEGRALRAGDLLPIGPEPPLPPAPRGIDPPARPERIRVTAGPQADWFAEPLSGGFQVSEQSDRMGLRLKGPSPIAARQGQLLTEGVSLGAIQVPAGGEPIVLFVEHQTTGGYPKIANVVWADLWAVGQLRPRDPVVFELVTLEIAAHLAHEQEARIARFALHY